MADVTYPAAGGVFKKLKDMGDGTHAEVVASSGSGGGTGSSVEVTNFPATQPVSGPLTNAQLTAQALASSANQATIITALGNILTELQTANGHLATIATNTTPAA